jgi:hypothetical protein
MYTSVVLCCIAAVSNVRCNCQGLEGELEKNSDVLNRNAIWSTTARVDQLPKYLCVQVWS